MNTWRAYGGSYHKVYLSLQINVFRDHHQLENISRIPRGYQQGQLSELTHT